MREMTKEQADAWLAGIFDSEGSLSVIEPPGGVACAAQIAQKDKRLLDKIKELTGMGSFRQHPGGCWYWVINGTNLDAFLDRVEPYLIVKAARVKLLRVIRSTITEKHSGRLTDHQKLLRIKLLDIWRQTGPITGRKGNG